MAHFAAVCAVAQDGVLHAQRQSGLEQVFLKILGGSILASCYEYRKWPLSKSFRARG